MTVAVLATALTLSACSVGATPGSDPSTSSSSASSTHNDADVSFATEMSAHHQQAIEMSNMILDKSGVDPKVTALAEDIKAAQGPELTKMKSWLDAWGKKSSGMSGMGGGMMMSDSDMNALKDASGLDASKLFLTQMTTHHSGALDMAKAEVDKGKNAAAIALAKNIIITQTAEIKTMSDLLGTL